MKISTITSTLFGFIVLSASNVAADSKFFKYPEPDATFSPGEVIYFLARETPDFDKRSSVDAKLYSENGDYVTLIKSFYGEYDDDNLEFTWKVDDRIVPGRYYVELRSSKDYDDTTRSNTFNIEDDSYYYGYSGYPGYRN